jgi:hypothetical protein
MKSKNLMILFIWLALLIIFSIFIIIGVLYSSDPIQWLVWTISDFSTYFILSLIFTTAVVFLIPENKTEVELLAELKTVKSELKKLTNEIEKIKKKRK